LRAYRLYLEGLNLYRNRSGPTGPQVIDRFKTAAELDDKFAEAHAALAMSYYTTVAGSVSNVIAKPIVELARAEALKAIELKPNLALPYSVLSSLDRKSFAWESAMRNAEKAVALDPNDALSRHFLGILQGTIGYVAKASDTFAEARELDPLFDRTMMYAAVVEFAKGNSKAAEALADRLTKSTRHLFSIVGHVQLATVARDRGDVAKAISHLRATLPATLRERPFVAAFEQALRAPEKRARAIQALKDEAARDPTFDPFPYFVFLHAMDEVFEIIFSELAAGETWRFDSYRQISAWRDQWALADPRFKDVVTRMGLVDYWKKHGWPDRCRAKGEDDFECS
jgi:tetratricopeptide (TPR) repeat protein